MKRIRFILILLTILPVTRLFAQTGEIIYRDYEPDSILVFWVYDGPIFFDLDVDGEVDDLKIRLKRSDKISYPIITTINPNLEICTVESDNDIILSEVEEEDWTNSIGWGGAVGAISLNYTHYGFRIAHENGYYYGWFETYSRYLKEVRTSVYAFDRTAYCTLPNYPLRWGQTELYDNVSENGTPDFATVLPNPNNGIFSVVGENLRQIEVLDVLGQRIATLQANSDRITIDLSSQPAGVYLVSVTDTEGRRCVKKVVKN